MQQVVVVAQVMVHQVVLHTQDKAQQEQLILEMVVVVEVLLREHTQVVLEAQV
jgi:hypothetical protein